MTLQERARMAATNTYYEASNIDASPAAFVEMIADAMVKLAREHAEAALNCARKTGVHFEGDIERALAAAESGR